MATIDATLNQRLGELIDQQTELLERFDGGLTQVENAKNASLVAIENKKNEVLNNLSTAMTMAIGNINSPLLDMPLKNSLAMRVGTGSVTYTCASTSTYIDRYGMLKTAAIDEPRFEADGYLNEGSGTNLLIYSEDFTNSAWTKGSYVTITANTSDTVDPYGTNLATKLQINNEKYGFIESVPYQSINKNAESKTYTVSAFVKPFGLYNSVRINPVDAADYSNNASTVISLTDEPTVLDISASGSFTNPKAFVRKLANGWFRVGLTFTTGTETILKIRPFFPYVGTVNTLSDGASGLYIFGVQLEENWFPTSYIPTTDSPTTRAANILNVTREGNMPNIGVDGVVTIAVDVVNLGANGYGQWIWGQSGSYGIGFSFENSGQIVLRYTNNSQSFFVNTNSPFPRNTKHRICGVASVPDQGNWVYVNGALKRYAPNYTGKIISNQFASSTIRIGGDNQGNIDSRFAFYGNISNFRIWDRALTPTEIALL